MQLFWSTFVSLNWHPDHDQQQRQQISQNTSPGRNTSVLDPLELRQPLVLTLVTVFIQGDAHRVKDVGDVFW